MVDKSWLQFGESDLLPCPKCHSTELDVLANVVECLDCDYIGPWQEGPEYVCDWREAINDWNIAAGGQDFWKRPKEKLIELKLVKE